MITRENYEIYIIDFLDGNLSIEDQKALMAFLERNLDLKEEFELMKDFQMPSANEVFENKASLKKDLTDQAIDETNIDEWSIASIENDLSDEDQQKFESEIAEREEFQQIYALYQHTKLKAEEIPYPDFKPWRLPNFNLNPKAEDLDFWVIAELENDLTPEQKQKWVRFKSQISNIEEVEESYRKIKLQPEAIVYPNKNELKHKKSNVRYLYPLGGIAAAAAAFYLFLNIANFKQDTYQNFNKQVAQIEQTQSKEKYVPKASVIHPVVLEQMAQTLQNVEQRKATTETEPKPKMATAAVMSAPTYATISAIEPIRKREVNIEVTDQNSISTEAPVEVITADNLMGEYIADNSTVNYNTDRNKLTLFKVAQKSVNALNDKMGTEMKLEAQYNAQGEKKKVKFSNRLFSVTKTVNK